MPLAPPSGNPLLTPRPADKIICTQTISSVEPFCARACLLFAQPTRLDEALDLAARTRPLVLAGGTDLMVGASADLGPGPVLDISRIAELKGIAIRLGAAAYPYDTLTFSGTVTEVSDGIATIEVVGRVSLGDHVTGTVRVVAA